MSSEKWKVSVVSDLTPAAKAIVEAMSPLVEVSKGMLAEFSVVYGGSTDGALMPLALMLLTVALSEEADRLAQAASMEGVRFVSDSVETAELGPAIGELFTGSVREGGER